MVNDRRNNRLKQLNLKAEKGYYGKSMKELFANPIIKVDVPYGAVLYNRLKEVWDCEMVVCISSEN